MRHAALPTLRTPRLTLRPLQASDAEAIVDGVGNFDVSRWLGDVPYPYDRADAEAFLAAEIGSARRTWAIDAGQGLIGIIAAGDRLGYWLARTAWRKGYGFEACVAVLSYWFSKTKAKSIEVGHFEGNTQSANIVRALGFAFVAHGTTEALSLQQRVPSLEYRLDRKAWVERQKFMLKTGRLTLRPIAEKDAPFLVDLARPEVARMLFRVRPGWSLSEAQDFARTWVWRGYPGFIHLIKQGRSPVGYIGYLGQDLSLVYALHPNFWGAGIISEALAAYIPALFDRFPVSRLKAEVFDDNPASAAVLRKFGFVETGQGVGPSAGRDAPARLTYFRLPRPATDQG